MAVSGSKLLLGHQKQLKASAISREVRDARGYRSVQQRTTLVQLGFNQRQSSLVPGLLIPIWDVYGDNSRYQFRPDKPPSSKSGKPRRYENPAGIGVTLDVHPLALDRVLDWRKPLWITEGIKKGDALVSADVAAIALYSVWGFVGTDESGAVYRLDAWNEVPLKGRVRGGEVRGRKVYIVFDSDVMKKVQVRLALERLGQFLRGRGADVRYIYLKEDEEGSKVGIDDYLAGGGTLKDLRASAVDRPLASGETHWTDTGNARRLVAEFGDRIRYCPAHKAWYLWNGAIWARDTTNAIMRLAKATVRKMYAEASAIENEKDRLAAMKFSLSSENQSRLEAMVKNAQSEGEVVIEPTQLNADEYVISVENGTLDLQTGELRAHDPADLITQMMPVAYDPKATDERWEEVLDLFVRQDDGKEAFLQRAAFASLTGSTSDKAFINLYDELDGNTGKTTFVESLRHTWGPYATMVNAESFLSNFRGGSSIRSDLADCDGKRMVVSSEIPPGRKLDVDLMKKLTGGFGKYRFERKHENSYENDVTFTIWLDGNNVAKARVEDNPLFDRWRLTPFKHQIPARRKDKKWLEKAAASPEYRAAVLAWVLKGRKAWLKNGMGTAPSVEEASAEVRAEMDPLRRFWEEEVRFGEDRVGDRYFATTAELRTRYGEWLGRQPGKSNAINEDDFIRLLKSRGRTSGIRNGPRRVDGRLKKGWIGVRLRAKRKGEVNYDVRGR